MRKRQSLFPLWYMEPKAIMSGHRGPVYALSASSRPGHFLSAGSDGNVVRWDLADPEQGHLLVRVGQAIFSLLLLDDANLLLIGTESGGLHVIDLNTGKEIHLFEVHRKGVFAMIGLPGSRVLCAGGDGSFSLWETNATGARRMQLLRQIPVCDAKLRGVAVAHDAAHFALACGDGTVRILDTQLFNELHTIQAHDGAAYACAWHPTKPVLLTAGRDGHLRSWRSDVGYKPLLELPAHEQSIYQIAIQKDGHHLATASRDGTAKLWDAATLQVIDRMEHKGKGHTRSVNALLWVGDQLISACDDGMVRSHPLP